MYSLLFHRISVSYFKEILFLYMLLRNTRKSLSAHNCESNPIQPWNDQRGTASPSRQSIQALLVQRLSILHKDDPKHLGERNAVKRNKKRGRTEDVFRHHP